MRTAEEILRLHISESGLYFDNNGNRLLLVSKATDAINEARKEAAVEFFKWNAEKISAYVVYLQDVQHMVRSVEIEENITKFEGSTIEERYNLFLNFLETKKQIIDELK